MSRIFRIYDPQYHFVTLLLLMNWMTQALIFRADQFTEVTQECKDSDRQPLTYILDEVNPAMYLSLDPTFPLKSLKKMRRTDNTKFFTNLAESRLFHDLALDIKSRPWPNTSNNNGSLDCVLQIQTQLPKGDKSGERYDALSMVVVELDFTGNNPTKTQIEVFTVGHEGRKSHRITKPAHYSDRIWAATNPNFLLSGQLSGFDSIDYRTKVDPQHIIKPDHLHSTFDKPASITINITRFQMTSNIYMVFTSYRHLRHGERCQDHKEFDCSPPTFLGSSTSHLCMSSNLACDGLPNCGQDFLPNQDENCFKIHWSSVLLSLVSYILLAITLLLCLSCFARVLIQWSVRSSLAELRGMNSPTGSFRSSSRFFSFLGNTFTSRWERPPPTYDEAMKHVNPDINRPLDPPAYSDTMSANGITGGDEASERMIPRSGSSHHQIHSPPVTTTDTPPPDYDSPFLEVASSLDHPTVVILPPTPSTGLPPNDNSASLLQSPPSTFTGTLDSSGGTKVVYQSTTTIEAEICPDRN